MQEQRRWASERVRRRRRPGVRVGRGFCRHHPCYTPVFRRRAPAAGGLRKRSGGALGGGGFGRRPSSQRDSVAEMCAGKQMLLQMGLINLKMTHMRREDKQSSCRNHVENKEGKSRFLADSPGTEQPEDAEDE